MKIDFFGDHKVKITLELQAQYKCKLEHRKIIGNAAIMEEFNKIHLLRLLPRRRHKLTKRKYKLSKNKAAKRKTPL